MLIFLPLQLQEATTRQQSIGAGSALHPLTSVQKTTSMGLPTRASWDSCMSYYFLFQLPQTRVQVSLPLSKDTLGHSVAPMWKPSLSRVVETAAIKGCPAVFGASIVLFPPNYLSVTWQLSFFFFVLQMTLAVNLNLSLLKSHKWIMMAHYWFGVTHFALNWHDHALLKWHYPAHTTTKHIQCLAFLAPNGYFLFEPMHSVSAQLNYWEGIFRP